MKRFAMVALLLLMCSPSSVKAQVFGDNDQAPDPKVVAEASINSAYGVIANRKASLNAVTASFYIASVNADLISPRVSAYFADHQDDTWAPSILVSIANDLCEAADFLDDANQNLLYMNNEYSTAEQDFCIGGLNNYFECISLCSDIIFRLSTKCNQDIGYANDHVSLASGNLAILDMYLFTMGY